jgi:hypothetical protein
MASRDPYNGQRPGLSPELVSFLVALVFVVALIAALVVL